jgi:hypothetical protein
MVMCLRCGYPQHQCCCPAYFTRGSHVEVKEESSREQLESALAGARRAVAAMGPGLARDMAVRAVADLELRLSKL